MYKSELKEEWVALRKQGRSLNEIVIITGQAKSSIYECIKTIPLSKVRRKEVRDAATQRIVDFNKSRRGVSIQGKTYHPFTIWTVENVSLLAHFLFDGTVSRVSCMYYNRSGVLIASVQNIMNAIYPYPAKLREKTGGVLRLEYNNVELAHYIAQKQQQLLCEIKNMSKPIKQAFLRAFFDDEGCITFDAKHNKRLVRGYQHDTTILELVQELLLDFGIESTLDASGHELLIRRHENLILFQRHINFSKGVTMNGARKNSIWRKDMEKRDILEAALKSYKGL